MSDEPDLLKPDKITDNRLQIDLGNLRDENEALRIENVKTKNQYLELLATNTDRVKGLQDELAELRSQLATLQTAPSITPAPEIELPEPAEALNLLKGKRKKSKADLGDVEALWEILEELTPDKGN